MSTSGLAVTVDAHLHLNDYLLSPYDNLSGVELQAGGTEGNHSNVLWISRRDFKRP